VLRPRGLGPALLAGLLWAAPSGAARFDGVEFAERFEAGATPLELHSVGLLRYRLLFKGYVAALYLEEGTSPARALEDVAKRLEIEYFWPIAGADFGRAAEDILRRQLGSVGLAPLRDRLGRLHAVYRDVRPGDRYALTYTPGGGTTLSLNGRRLATVSGADFAAAYFGLWLAEDPVDEALREQLLGGR
jgi:hypothetical protein